MCKKSIVRATGALPRKETAKAQLPRNYSKRGYQTQAFSNSLTSVVASAKALGTGAAILARKTLMLLKGVGKMIRPIIT
jgi:hypothetical protein